MKESRFTAKYHPECEQCKAFKICKFVEHIAAINGDVIGKSVSLPIKLSLVMECELVPKSNEN